MVGRNKVVFTALLSHKVEFGARTEGIKTNLKS